MNKSFKKKSKHIEEILQKHVRCFTNEHLDILFDQVSSSTYQISFMRTLLDQLESSENPVAFNDDQRQYLEERINKAQQSYQPNNAPSPEGTVPLCGEPEATPG